MIELSQLRVSFFNTFSTIETRSEIWSNMRNVRDGY